MDTNNWPEETKVAMAEQEAKALEMIRAKKGAGVTYDPPVPERTTGEDQNSPASWKPWRKE